jgi:hypothetical protein
MKSKLSERQKNFKKDADPALIKKSKNSIYSSYYKEIAFVLETRLEKHLKHEEKANDIKEALTELYENDCFKVKNKPVVKKVVKKPIIKKIVVKNEPETNDTNEFKDIDVSSFIHSIATLLDVYKKKAS